MIDNMTARHETLTPCRPRLAPGGDCHAILCYAIADAMKAAIDARAKVKSKRRDWRMVKPAQGRHAYLLIDGRANRARPSKDRDSDRLAFPAYLISRMAAGPGAAP